MSGRVVEIAGVHTIRFGPIQLLRAWYNGMYKYSKRATLDIIIVAMTLNSLYTFKFALVSRLISPMLIRGR